MHHSGPTLMARLLEALKHMLYISRLGMMMRHYDPDTSLILLATYYRATHLGLLYLDPLNQNGTIHSR